MQFLYTKTTPSKREVAAVILLVWLVIVISTAAGHAPWRDEVCAFTRAIAGKSVFGMLSTLHEGHPSLWYLLLRVVNNFFPTPQVLPVVTVIIAAAAMAVLAFCSPFSLPFITAVLLTRFGFWEYPVMQRSYGISMLLLFLLAHYYPSHKDRGVLLGSLLFLLVNCEALSLVMTFAFLLFWFLDIVFEKENRQPRLKNFAVNAAIALLGTVVSLWILVPDHAKAPIHGMGIYSAFSAAVSKALSPGDALFEITRPHWLGDLIDTSHNFLKRIPFLILVGGMLGLARRPAALIAALAALVGFCAFSALVLGGGYRHHALLLLFFIALYWIVGKEEKENKKEDEKDAKGKCMFWLRYAGSVLFVLLILVQIPDGVRFLYYDLSGEQPNSRSGDVSVFIHDHPEFKDAIIISDVDFFLQPLPYYIHNHNRLFNVRQNAYMINGVPPDLGGRDTIPLADVLDNARTLHAQEKAPVLILLNDRLNAPNSVHMPPKGYMTPWGLTVTPEQREAFLNATTLLQSYGPTLSDETYDVYMLNDSEPVKH